MALSLRSSLIAASAIPLACSLLLGCALAGWHAMRSVRTELAVALEVGQQTVVAGVKDLPSADDPGRELLRLVHTFDGNRHVIATLVGADGGVLARSHLFSPPSAVPAWFCDLIAPRIPPATIVIPPYQQQQLHIRLRTDPVNETGEVWGDFRDAIQALALFCALMVLMMSWTVRRLLRPITNVLAGLSQIRAGDYDARVAERGPAELAALARGFNKMAGHLAAAKSQNARLQQQIANLQDEERAHLARDLHDEVGPSLFVMGVAAATISELVRAGRGDAVLEQVGLIRSVVARTQGHIKEILGRLRPNRAMEFGLCPAIEDLVAFWRTHCPTISFRAELSVDEMLLSERLKGAIYRITQEALTNAVRHGRPSQVGVTLTSEADLALLQVVDDGVGLPVDAGPGFGLAGVRERVTALAGSFSLDRAVSGSGCRLTVRLPVTQPVPPLAAAA